MYMLATYYVWLHSATNSGNWLRHTSTLAWEQFQLAELWWPLLRQVGYTPERSGDFSPGRHAQLWFLQLGFALSTLFALLREKSNEIVTRKLKYFHRLNYFEENSTQKAETIYGMTDFHIQLCRHQLHRWKTFDDLELKDSCRSMWEAPSSMPSRNADILSPWTGSKDCATLCILEQTY